VYTKHEALLIIVIQDLDFVVLYSRESAEKQREIANIEAQVYHLSELLGVSTIHFVLCMMFPAQTYSITKNGVHLPHFLQLL
jgi:hypothetical protein